MKSRELSKPFISINCWAAVGKCGVAVAMCWLLLVHFAMNNLMAHAPLKKADWIVLLGGESGERAVGAAELYHDGVAANIFVTGAGDCLSNVRTLKMLGVPGSSIEYECASHTTFENAIYTKEYLIRSNPQSVILVTSWYHTARALRTFSHAWPNIQFGTVGVIPAASSWYWLPFAESGAITMEYAKNLWYLIRYGLTS